MGGKAPEVTQIDANKPFSGIAMGVLTKKRLFPL
jgi:hypothetical protein